MIKVSPSILAANPLEMGKDIEKAANAGCDMLHVDIMDAHFVPNLSYSPALSLAIHKAFPDLPLDVHLMMGNPEKYIDAFAACKPQAIAIHAEIPGDVAALLRDIRSRGILAVLTLKPGTPVSAVTQWLPLCDRVLIMTVEPGFGGQSFMAEQLEKIPQLRAAGFTGEVEADGGISLKNIEQCAQAGLNIAVMGTAFFRSEDPAMLVNSLHRLAN